MENKSDGDKFSLEIHEYLKKLIDILNQRYPVDSIFLLNLSGRLLAHIIHSAVPKYQRKYALKETMILIKDWLKEKDENETKST